MIDVTAVVTLGAPGDSAGFPEPPQIARDSRGRYYAVTPNRAQEPIVLDAEGQFVRRLGQLGEGPGEYLQPYAVVVGSGDTLYLFDAGNRRLTVLTPDYQVVRTRSGIRRPYDVVRRADGALFTDVQSPGDSAVHQFDQLGEHVRSFGSVRGVCTRCTGPAFALAPMPGGDLIGVQRALEYRVVQWDSLGRERAAWPIEAPWFPASDSIPMISPETPPPPEVMGAWFEDGHLWVLGWAAAIDWHRGLGRARRGEGGREFYPIDDYSALYDGIIDVIDLETHRVIAHRRLSSAAAILRVAPGLVAGIREGSDGWWYADILRVRLTGT